MEDADLRRALRRREPSEGFSGRLLERIRTEKMPGIEHTPPVRARAWIAAALAVAASVVVTVGIAREESARRDAESRLAAQNLEVALQITGETLQHVQMKVTHFGEDGYDNQSRSR